MVMPVNLEAALARICDDAEIWMRRCDQLLGEFDGELQDKRTSKKLREAIERTREVLDKSQ